MLERVPSADALRNDFSGFRRFKRLKILIIWYCPYSFVYISGGIANAQIDLLLHLLL